ncbi:uncharacterized protein P884DRAFT_285426 [Thermothelomyces heterothallicus CBS 202.75]|uniref:uncharacterized protein n=1 Tax=Thermothelomyces heterothallicus CBS 202.75 TaxID=1149848 RepID=UPI003742019F
MTKFRNGTRRSAPRLPDKEWERMKQVIMDKYRILPLEAVVKYMKKEHNFSATRRQYIHRLNRWGVRKYKPTHSGPVPRSSPATSGSDAPPPVDIDELCVVRIRPSSDYPDLTANAGWPKRGQRGPPRDSLLWLADMLSLLGDFRNVGRIVMEQWKTDPRRYGGDAWLSTTRAKMEPKVARMLARSGDRQLGPSQDSWERLSWEFRHAYTYCTAGGEETHGEEQLAIALDRVIFQDGRGGDRLKQLDRRVSGLDTPAYVLLRSALARYNSVHPDDKKFDLDNIMQQFVAQHLPTTTRSGPDITCLSSCLRWCISQLEKNDAGVPPQVPRPPGTRRRRSAIRPGADDFFTTLCTFWHHLSQESGGILPCRRGDGARAPAWALDAEDQLGIQAPYLLGIVVCMITAADLQETCGEAARRPVLERALAGAKALDRLLVDRGRSGEDALLEAFLRQACAVGWPLTELHDRDLRFRVRDVRVDADSTAPYRRYIAESLRVSDLPPPT